MLLGKKVTSVLHGRSVSWISSLSSPQILYTFQDLTILLLMFSLMFLQSPNPSQIDYDCIAETQQTDQELHTLIASGTSLELKKVTFPNSSTEIMCDLSTGTARPYIPKQHRQDVFSAMHNLSHPGIRRSVHLMKQSFVWPSISSDVAKWARHCLACQKSKIHRHTR
ncbi:integrase catalytic domain-containing protein [Trichonephila clavipes]|nr:integrase catalytic domain-containing protein [Trichonephila clavipes]